MTGRSSSAGSWHSGPSRSPVAPQTARHHRWRAIQTDDFTASLPPSHRAFSPAATTPADDALERVLRPRCWAKVIAAGPARDRLIYRTTVQASERSADTVAMLQEVHQPY